MDRVVQAHVQGDKWIKLSEHKQGKDIVFPNALDVAVENTSNILPVTFMNQLPEGTPIPDIGTEQNQISVIYVYFPIGDGEAYLTTKDWAEKMTCYAPYNWGVEQAFDPDEYGVYFKLYPLYDYELAPREKMYFSISHIVAFGELEKMVYAAVRFTNIPVSSGEGGSNQTAGIEANVEGTDFLPLFKRRSPLAILTLACNRTKAAVGDRVKLEWAVAGDAMKCVLTPGDIVVDQVGCLETEVFADTTFRLYAFGVNEQISRTAMVYVETPVISKFSSNLPDGKTKFGQPVVLSYEVKNSYGVYLNQGIGRVTDTSISVVPASAVTTYVLSCMGPSGLVQQQLTITITDFLKCNMLSFDRISHSDGSNGYVLRWDVVNCSTIKLTTSDGTVRSSGQSSGKIQFDDPSASLTVKLECTGTAGQTYERVCSAN